MTDAKRDGNSVTTELATDSADGVTPVRVQVNPSNHALKVDDDVTGSDLSGDIAARDNNSVTVIMAASSADGVTPVAVYLEGSSGKLLIKST